MNVRAEMFPVHHLLSPVSSSVGPEKAAAVEGFVLLDPRRTGTEIREWMVSECGKDFRKADSAADFPQKKKA